MRKLKKTIAGAGILGAAIFAVARPASAQEPAAPESYRLVEVAGAALPALLEEEDGCREEVTAATLMLDADGGWALVVSEREVCGDAVEEEEEREEGTYEVEGDAIRFLDDDTVAGSGEVDDHDGNDGDIDLEDLTDGTRSGDDLTVLLEDGETVLVFRR